MSRAILHPASLIARHTIWKLLEYIISHLCSHHPPIRCTVYITMQHWIKRGHVDASRWHVILASSTKNIANIASLDVIVIDPFVCRLRSIFCEYFFQHITTLFFTARTRVTPSLPCTPSCTRIMVCLCCLILSRRSRLASTPARVLMRITSHWTSPWRSIPLVSMVLEKRGRILISEVN